MRKEKDNLLRLVDNFSGKKIAVWGDFILDEYIFGTTRRISREAPVMIISYRNSEYSLGGAGNSVLNLKALGAEVLPIGVIGSDTSGKKILHILRKKRVTTEHLIIDRKFQTPVKTRILAGEETARKQQVLRIDREEKVADSSALKLKIQRFVENTQSKVNALLVSDYDYLTVKEDIFRRVQPGFKKKGIPIALDSRFRLLNFKGVTVSTPNEPEVEGALHIRLDDDSKLLKKAGEELLQRSQAAAVLVTRGSKGMVLFETGKPSFVFPVHGTTDIVDVTGAGDTVISVFTLALTCGATFKQAAQLANYAGSVVVMKKGTATLSAAELKKAISS
ncbi:MAG: bifunctional ADP-heptose synthase [Candidatus Aminicenantes bacterium]|nr:bifunctional ADP-heptose synthase [Candidatus Aminicenantes bacterium]MDH5466767.1 bifunctional ADP-heptose synthase [Candidatus Aminicenantes bacterium]MDH5707364.1 bifunctional ADP-heptose synthase [Candidatus Aminicenantes bacterium]